MAKKNPANGRPRVAIVDGCRTPFAKAWTDYKDLSALDLSTTATAELLARNNLSPEEIDEVIMGCVIPTLNGPNLAREIVLALDLPKRIPGFTLNRACASSFQSVTSAAESIMAGQNQVVLAGGAESMSSVPVPYSKKVINALLEFRKARTLQAKLKALSAINPARDLLPANPDLNELATGLTMGQSAELMARKNSISRDAQDDLAYQSHSKAAAAIEQGLFQREVVPAFTPPDRTVLEDNGVRKNPDRAALSTLKPVFDRRYGTITAGNASPLTDGAAMVLLMHEEKARALGYTPKGYIRSYGYASLDPNDQLLLGPAYAVPIALDRGGVSLKDMDIVDMHEAFAAQVLSCLQAMASKQFAQERLGRSEAVGEVDPARFNVHGGSIAIGHPFAATGARMIVTALNALERRNGKLGLITACAAGAMGAAMVLERE